MTDTITPQMKKAHEPVTMEFTSTPMPSTTTPEEFIKLVKQDKGEFVQTEADVGGAPI